MIDALVVGAGYWGVAIARLLRQRGFQVDLVDDGHPRGSSRNSAGIFQKWWYKAETTSKRAPSAWDASPDIDWLLELGLAQQTGEAFTNEMNGNSYYRPDCYLADPKAILSLEPVQDGMVVYLRDSKEGVDAVFGHIEDPQERYRKVFVAAGAWTDKLLVRSGLEPVGVKPLRGRAVIGGHAPKDGTPSTVLAAPYKHYTTRAWGDKVRIGDTVEPTYREALPDDFLRLARPVMNGDYHFSVQDGLRPVTKQYVVEPRSDNIIVATGGHRVGLGLAMPVARRALELAGWN